MSDNNAQYTPDVADDTYKSRTGQNEIRVQSDDAPVNDPIDAGTADSDEQLVRDDQDAIDKSNIIKDRTRGLSKQNYAEPSDDEGLPGPEDGTSSGRQ
ncbi:uncharacterized protein BDZ99DRAFT_237570 [Mytilinidion resinicola]|uniref:Histone chaperone domain-containing protein n=1 Tax=Mytilinidion resinicola TaxID=574789 RepID=A0A6A6Z0X2_9PEZI|nr:uncharacterized protein BDZ99DRAFT_237570 [Mytilinidion resinicola]KAF2814438.1 hypothetical protein BDZ99DRAFT_237570 [Mytilinidion resinicola]